MPVLVVPYMLHTTTAIAVIGFVSTLAVPTSTSIVIILKVPPVVHSVTEPTLEVLAIVHLIAELTPEAPVEVPPFHHHHYYSCHSQRHY